jgi:hypothetical protein
LVITELGKKLWFHLTPHINKEAINLFFVDFLLVSMFIVYPTLLFAEIYFGIIRRLYYAFELQPEIDSLSIQLFLPRDFRHLPLCWQGQAGFLHALVPADRSYLQKYRRLGQKCHQVWRAGPKSGHSIRWSSIYS